jgi:hypothetical protein
MNMCNIDAFSPVMPLLMRYDGVLFPWIFGILTQNMRGRRLMITIFVVLLLTFSILHPHTTVAQPQSTNPAVCEYQEKRNFPINPKTNKPYTPDERNQEPFDGGSISKDEIRQCLQAGTPIKNHHIIFDDYWQAWASLAKETGDYTYTIPLRIEGGVLHAPYDEEAVTGGIRLWEFRDPNVNNSSNLTEEERKAFRVEQKDVPIALIRSKISWKEVFINSAVTQFSEGSQKTDDILSVIFSAEANFSDSAFSKLSGGDIDI